MLLRSWFIASALALMILPGHIIGYSQHQAKCNPSNPLADTITKNSDWLPCEQSLHGTVMVFVPAGQFRMGSTQEEITAAHRMLAETHPLLDEANAEKMSFFDGELMPEHGLQHVSSFWIDKYEVSNTQFRQCVLAAVCVPVPGYPPEDDYPIQGVRWNRAMQYCEWRGGQLPSEVEWEYAARGTDRLIYPWGNSFDRALANLKASPDGILEASAVSVDTLPQGASWVGAHHMSGNVAEWTRSHFAPYPYRADDGREDVSQTSEQDYVIRGGSYMDDAAYLRAARRGRHTGNLQPVGFRCVYPPDVEELPLMLDDLPAPPDITVHEFSITPVTDDIENHRTVTVQWDVSGVDHVTLRIQGFVSYQRPQIRTIAAYDDLPNSGEKQIDIPDVPASLSLIVDPRIYASYSPNRSFQLLSDDLSP